MSAKLSIIKFFGPQQRDMQMWKVNIIQRHLKGGLLLSSVYITRVIASCIATIHSSQQSV